MKSIYMKFPNLKALILILLLLTCLTALNRCVAQHIVDDDVLQYLLKRPQKAFYMEKDIKLADSTINIQNKIIENKDSLLSNKTQSMQLCEAEKEITQLEVEGLTKENKSIKKKVSFFKFTTIGAAIIGSISTIYFIVH